MVRRYSRIGGHRGQSSALAPSPDGGERSRHNRLFPSTGDKIRMIHNKKSLFYKASCCLPFLSLISTAALGEALVVEPSVSARAFYDDNAALTVNKHKATSSSELLGALKLSRMTEAMELQGVARLNMLLSSGGNVYRDKDNQLISLVFAKKGELSRWEIAGSWRRDSIVRSVRVTDVSDVSTEPDDDVDAGLVHESVRRNRYIIKPSWSYRFSPRTEVAAGYGFDSVVFEDTRDTTLFDYQNQSLFGRHFYRITERDRITTTLRMKQFRAAAAKRDYDSSSLLVGLEHSYSETAKGHFQVGWQHTRYESRFEDGTNEGLLAQIYAEKRTGLTKFSGRLGRSTFASGAGDVVISDELVFNMVRGLSETVRFSLRIKAFQNESMRRDNPDANRRYLSLTPALSWRVTQWWSVDAFYRYRRQNRDTDSLSAESNAVYLSMRYARPTPL